VGRLLNRGVRLHTDAATQVPVFVTVDCDAILDLLEERGVQVSRIPAPASNGGPIDALMDHPALLILFLCIAVPLTVLFAVLAHSAAELPDASPRPRQGSFAASVPPCCWAHNRNRLHTSCSVIQTWTWLPAGGRSASEQCRDASSALSSAFSNAEANSPLPAGAVCNYFTIVDSFFHPRQESATSRPS
jgi:hypothetical protein